MPHLDQLQLAEYLSDFRKANMMRACAMAIAAQSAWPIC
jgi:hypothetical protein